VTSWPLRRAALLRSNADYPGPGEKGTRRDHVSEGSAVYENRDAYHQQELFWSYKHHITHDLGKVHCGRRIRLLSMRQALELYGGTRVSRSYCIFCQYYDLVMDERRGRVQIRRHDMKFDIVVLLWIDRQCRQSIYRTCFETSIRSFVRRNQGGYCCLRYKKGLREIRPRHNLDIEAFRVHEMAKKSVKPRDFRKVRNEQSCN
jgi:hypothetical protein